jgi:hypothetical protein
MQYINVRLKNILKNILKNWVGWGEPLLHSGKVKE